MRSNSIFPRVTNLGCAHDVSTQVRIAINIEILFIELFFRSRSFRPGCFCKIPSKGEQEILLQNLVSSFTHIVLLEFPIESFAFVQDIECLEPEFSIAFRVYLVHDISIPHHHVVILIEGIHFLAQADIEVGAYAESFCDVVIAVDAMVLQPVIGFAVGIVAA